MNKKISAGIVIICQQKILLAHPTGSADDMWAISKGGVEDDETVLQAAVRETQEEIGYLVDVSLLTSNLPLKFQYKNKKGKRYKVVYCYVLRLTNMPSFVVNDVWPTSMLQLTEIDQAKFFTKEAAKDKIFWRMQNLLNLLE